MSEVYDRFVILYTRKCFRENTLPKAFKKELKRVKFEYDSKKARRLRIALEK